MVMHPFKPELDGPDLSADKDRAGKFLIQESVQVIKAGGAGFVPYVRNKPDSDELGQKVSHPAKAPAKARAAVARTARSARAHSANNY